MFVYHALAVSCCVHPHVGRAFDPARLRGGFFVIGLHEAVVTSYVNIIPILLRNFNGTSYALPCNRRQEYGGLGGGTPRLIAYVNG